jgi:hypothetical protein
MTRSSRTLRRLRWQRRIVRLHRRLVLRSFALEVIAGEEFTDDTVTMLEDRLIRLEEIVAARWPRSAVLRRRLARELRASAARGAHAGPGFARQRVQAVSEDLLMARQRRRGAVK